MNMKRKIITLGESGNIIMPSNITDIWMSEPELVGLFGITAPALCAAVRAIYKSGALKEYEVQKYIRLENGYHADVFSLTMIVALAFFYLLVLLSLLILIFFCPCSSAPCQQES